MRKSEDVVIHMQVNSELILLYPMSIEWKNFFQQFPMEPFSEETVIFLNMLSVSLLHDPEVKAFPDVVTFAFFCRKGNILKLKDMYTSSTELRMGRGVVFHIAPSNVPVSFAYSWAAGLLAGNLNVVKVPSKLFPQVDLIVRHLRKLQGVNASKEMTSRMVFVRYDRTSEATAFISAHCDVRVIWGGDASIAAIRKNEIPPRAFDVCFADRYSLAVLRASAVLELNDKRLAQLAEAFYNDTYLFDQNACSAPHLIVWLGSDIGQAKKRFWEAVYRIVAAKYVLQPVISVNKLVTFYRQAVAMDIKHGDTLDNLVVRAELKSLPYDIEKFRCEGGYFSECTISSLDDFAQIINTKYQTLAYFGFSVEELQKFIKSNRLKGLDRLVPIGRAADFSLTWDGWDLVKTLSRVVSIL